MGNSDVELKEVAISVDPIKSLMDLVEEGRNRGSQLQPSISMVPRKYRDQHPNCFDPQVVSIGPLHRDHKNLQEQEGLKGAYMHDLLARLNSPPQHTLERCLLKVNSSINEIKLCYGGMNSYHDFDVAKMMVTDAYFILEFILKNLKNDPLLCSGNTFMRDCIFMDLLLIENQIPFFVLQDIFEMTLMKIQQNGSLITLLLDHVLCHCKLFTSELKIDNNGTDVYKFKHILEVFHKSCWPDVLLPKYYGSPALISHSVVELDRAGVTFKPNRRGNMEMAMESESFRWLWIFWPFRKQTLRMPVLNIHDKTELLLRNLITYEQSYPNVDVDVDSLYFTSFVAAMDMLVDSKEDVVKLVESKVIVNNLGSHEGVANLINNLCSEVNYSTFMYRPQFQQLDDYYKSYWPKNMAWLRRKYFNSPWNVIALVAGILLFALTATQTIFAVLST